MQASCNCYNIYLKPELGRKVREEAERLSLSVSSYVRMALTEYFERKESEKEAKKEEGKGG